jgi:hypothetical protein
MNIALLFNANAPKYGFSYGDPVRRAVFGLGILQASKRHMKVSVGDVGIYSHAKTWAHYDQLTERVYYAGTWTTFLEDRLHATFREATIYALTFENMTKEIAAELHAALTPNDAYLGLMQVDYTYGPHLALMRNSMITLYRIEGETCRVFFSMGSEDGRDDQEQIEMGKLGYTDVDWEDRGAHGTIFDDFDTLEHFQRVAAFREAVTPFMPGGEDEAYELVMVLEDLNPQLFNALGAAVSALERAQTEEDVAQAATSGRRYIEKLAEVLFPARKESFKGRKVGNAEYRNRIWAYIDENTGGDLTRLQGLGEEVDRLVETFNAGLHGDGVKPRILQALADTGVLTAGLLALNPSAARKPYFAHQKSIVEFLRRGADRAEASKPEN